MATRASPSATASTATSSTPSSASASSSYAAAAAGSSSSASAASSSAAASPAPPAGPPQHLVDMNVMRLFAEPTLQKLPITHAVDGLQDGGIGLTSMLSLPTAFGEIYLGQTFNCYVNIVNNNIDGANRDVQVVSLSAELSFPVLRSNGSKTMQKVALRDARCEHSHNPAQSPVVHEGAVVPPGKNIDLLIEHQLLSEEYRYAPDAAKKKSSSSSDKRRRKQASLPESTFQLLVVIVYKAVGGGEPDGPDRRLKRWFKFGVKKPLQEKYRTSVVGDRTVVEVQLQNLCSTPVVIRDVAFTPASGFTLISCNNNNDDDDDDNDNRATAATPSEAEDNEASSAAPSTDEAKEDVTGAFGRGQQRTQGPPAGKRLADVVEHALATLQETLLAPGAFKRKLFVLTSGTADKKSEQPAENDAADEPSHDIPRLGNLHVDWSGPMGESSRLAFAPLKCHVKPALPVEVTTRLADPSQRIVYGRPFTIVLTIRNKSELPMHLSLRVPMRTFAPVAPLNMLQEQLGTLPLRGVIEQRVEMLPLAYGPYKIDGIVVMDSKRNKYVARPLAVFVNSEQAGE